MFSICKIWKRTILVSIFLLVLAWITISSTLRSRLEQRARFSGKLFSVHSEEINQEEFDSLVDNLYKRKKSNVDGSNFWLLDTSSRVNEISVPSYYYDKSVSKPPIQIFDPRLTLATYLSHLAEVGVGEVPFHWYDWADMSFIDKYILAKPDDKPNCHIAIPFSDDPIKGYCRDDSRLPTSGNNNGLGFSVFKPSHSSIDPQEGVLLSRSYLYSTAPVPQSIVFNAKNGLYEMSIKGKQKLLESKLINQVLQNEKKDSASGKFKLDPTSALKKLVLQEPKKVLETEISEASFHFDHEGVIGDFEKSLADGVQFSSSKEKRYYESLKYSQWLVESNKVNKYLREANLHDGVNGEHYDWRFFSGDKDGSYEESLVLHRLIRNWLSFSRKAGVKSWLAHGSLLSWYWNGMSFPWESDIDIQIPIQDLHKLARQYNQSVIVEDVSEGFGRYFLDVTSSITLREKGNGLNNIDARFIDIDTGFFIDITGLSISNMETPSRYLQKVPEEFKVNKFPEAFSEESGETKKEFKNINEHLRLYNCRNGHFISYDDLFPLLKASVEGEIGYIPSSYSRILSSEYSNGMLKKNYAQHVFLPKLRMWVKDEDLKLFIQSPKEWQRYYHPETGIYVNGNVLPLIQKSRESEIEPESEPESSFDPDEYSDTLRFSVQEFRKVEELTYEDLLSLVLKNDIFMEYVATRQYTSTHKDDIDRIFKSKFNRGPGISTFMESIPSFRQDYFMYRFHSDHFNYDEAISRMMKEVQESNKL
ncbi:hypothetical protein CLIB1423_04S05490 [[Candida] railenensis]|uniref:LicD/FKTN/FKRP nucleotidyltransferase domain-containing protein n=1 Tax=[Candida] railenensis TaxID=45579 RepID=A0A9P0QM46_9ASCO|nr:hypothetical protein CLIB1423_04S05490 [[Candida] railenensis]